MQIDIFVVSVLYNFFTNSKPSFNKPNVENAHILFFKQYLSTIPILKTSIYNSFLTALSRLSYLLDHINIHDG